MKNDFFSDRLKRDMTVECANCGEELGCHRFSDDACPVEVFEYFGTCFSKEFKFR